MDGIEARRAWQLTPLSAIDQDLIRLTFVVGSGTPTDLKSRILVKRVWAFPNDIQTEENAQFVYPGPRVVLRMPIPQDFIDAGFGTYKIQVKQYYRYRYVLVEPIFYVQIEVQ